MKELGARHLVLALLVTATTSGCRGACGGSGASLAVEAGAVVVDAARPDGGLAASRCHAEGAGLALGAGSDVLFGEAMVKDGTIYLGVVRRGDSGRVASLAIVPADLGQKPVFVDLGATMGDAPAPRPFLLGGAPHVAHYATERRDGGRAVGRVLAIGRVQDAHIEPRLRVPQPEDESLTFDVASSPTEPSHDAGALLVWDDDDGIGVRALDANVTSASSASSPLLDAGAPLRGGGESLAPRAMPRQGGGYWVVWLARRPEPEEDGAPPPLEGAGEERSYSWLEAAAYDAHGTRTGDVLRLTSLRGHVAGFDLDAASGAVAFVSDEEAREGEGGRLFALMLGRDKIEAGPTLMALGSGGGAPDARGPFIADVDVGDHARLVPASASGPAPASGDPRPSAEPWLDGGRLLVELPSGGKPGSLFVALVAGERGSADSPLPEPRLRQIRCP